MFDFSGGSKSDFFDVLWSRLCGGKGVGKEFEEHF